AKLLEVARGTRQAIQLRIRSNLGALLAEISADSPVNVLRVEGGWYAVLRLPETRSDEEWALDFLEEGVLIHPGYYYDFPNGSYAVLSLLTPPETFTEGVRRLLARVRGAGR